MAADGIASRFDSTAYPAANERLFQSILAMPSSALRARPGVRQGSGTIVTVDSTGVGTVTVAAHSGIINDTGAGAGSYEYAITTSKIITLGARPGAGTSRIVEIVAHILNVDERIGDGTGNRYVEIYAIAGSAAASPVAPAIPTGQLRLAELTVPSSGTILVANPAQRTAAMGGVLTVASVVERDLIENMYDGMMVYVEDIDVLQMRRLAAWQDVVLKVDTGWATIPLHTGFTAQTGPPDATPQKRTCGVPSEVKLRGRVNGTFAATSVILIADAGAVPSPPKRHECPVSGHSAASACRGYVDVDGSITVVTGASAPGYVYLDGLSDYTLD
jgi:hypothetical protein